MLHGRDGHLINTILFRRGLDRPRLLYISKGQPCARKDCMGGKTIKVPCAVAKRVFQYAVLHDPFATSWYVCVQASVSSKTLSVICACPRDKYMKGAEGVRGIYG